MSQEKDILSEIILHKRTEIEAQKRSVPLLQMMENIPENVPTRSMCDALVNSSTGIIAEFKRKSPSKKWINKAAEIQQIIPAYEAAGASAISVLTDEEFFGGTLRDLRTARSLTSLPIIRKDFIIDEYQLYQAKITGADAVLLIASALNIEQFNELLEKAHQLNLEVLLEIHQESELPYISEKVDMIGINNRNLGTFHTQVENSFRLAKQLPEDTIWVSESGISQPHIVQELRSAGFNGFLIGETFMKEPLPGDALKSFIGRI